MNTAKQENLTKEFGTNTADARKVPGKAIIHIQLLKHRMSKYTFLIDTDHTALTITTSQA